MIKPSPEMIEAVRAATGCPTPNCHNCTTNAKAAATALLATLDLDYRITKRQRTRRVCGVEGPDGLRCERTPHPVGSHANVAEGQGLVKW